MARVAYIPQEKINTPIHYFKAAQSKPINHIKWQKYARQQVKFYEINGNHYSIFQLPEVMDFAKKFNAILPQRYQDTKQDTKQQENLY